MTIVLEPWGNAGGVVRWESRTSRRFYELRIQRDLFGHDEAWQIWGGIGSKRGGCMRWPLTAGETAERVFARIDRERAGRGYQLVLNKME